MSRAALILCIVEAVLALAMGMGLILSGSDPATQGLDRLSGIVLILVVGLFVTPAMWLAIRGGRPVLSLSLALAPIAVVAILFAALVVSLP